MVCFFSFVFYSSLWLVVEKGEGGRGKDGRSRRTGGRHANWAARGVGTLPTPCLN